MNTVPCSICQEGGHHPRSCPALREPLKPGFFAPSGGQGHSHDDDEKLKGLLIGNLVKWHTLESQSLLKKLSV